MMQNEIVKIAVLCLPGLQTFLDPVVDHLSYRFDVRACFSNDPKELTAAVAWSDVVWIEWANELAVMLTNTPGLLDQKWVICRLHSYEAFVEDYLTRIRWGSIDTLVFVATHVKTIVEDRVKDLEAQVGCIKVIPNGIDVNAYGFKERRSGFDLAYVGYINYKKGPMLLLHAFRELVNVDLRYHLHMAGTIQDRRYAYYFRQMIDEWKLDEHIHFHGWVDDVNGWLQDKNFIVSSSVLESQGMGILEAMACGIKPVIHHFVGAETIYPQDYLWSTITDFVAQIRASTYNSINYRQFVHERFDLHDQLKKIEKVIMGQPLRKKVVSTHFQMNRAETLQSSLVEESQPQRLDGSRAIDPQMELILKKCLHPGMRVLDVGCKDGKMARYLADQGASVVAVDASTDWIEKARRESSHPSIVYEAVEYNRLHLGQRFDLILLIQVIEHIAPENIRDFLAAIVAHASDRSVVYVDIRDPRYVSYLKTHDPTNPLARCEAYALHVLLALFAEYGLHPYHMGIYGDRVPAQFNEYLFASVAMFATAYEKANQ